MLEYHCVLQIFHRSQEPPYLSACSSGRSDTRDIVEGKRHISPGPLAAGTHVRQGQKMVLFALPLSGRDSQVSISYHVVRARTCCRKEWKTCRRSHRNNKREVPTIPGFQADMRGEAQLINADYTLSATRYDSMEFLVSRNVHVHFRTDISLSHSHIHRKLAP